MLKARLITALAAALLSCAASTAAAPTAGPVTGEERVAALWVRDELRAFSGKAEFRRYLAEVRRAARSRGRWWASRARGNAIIVTGSRIMPRNASITNVQEEGVDEGDVVKQIDRFLIVLQDGRLFSIDTGAQAGERLALADRINVYRRVPTDPDADEVWYDELLVRGDRVLVTGYDYELGVSELSIFQLKTDGRFERMGVFQISSDDYYSRRNYATRLVGDNLVIYTPFNLARDTNDRIRFPTARRIGPGEGVRHAGRQRPLLDVRSVYGPLLPTLDPLMHSFSVCPLDRAEAGRDLGCRTRAFVGPASRNFYVSQSHVYLWVGPDRDRRYDLRDEPDCAVGHRASHDEAEQAIVYRIPIGPGDPQAVPVRGEPFDQFSFDEEGGALRALVEWRSAHCPQHVDDPAVHLSYMSLPLSRFSRFVEKAPASDFVALPPTGDTDLANRFTATHLAYAPLREVRYEEGPEGERDFVHAVPSELIVVPLADPRSPRRLRLGHNVRRLEVLGSHLLAGGASPGARDDAALSLIALGSEPRIASSLRLPDRYDGEGRSHAFNFSLQPDGNGLFGLPTVGLPAEAAHEAWWSLPSDLSFFSIEPDGKMEAIGLLASSLPRYREIEDVEEHMLDGEPDEDLVPGYSCEISCIDWYGNSRPIFTGGRIFGLSGTELIEGRVEGGRVIEVQRLDFARARPTGPRS